MNLCHDAVLKADGCRDLARKRTSRPCPPDPGQDRSSPAFSLRAQYIAVRAGQRGRHRGRGVEPGLNYVDTAPTTATPRISSVRSPR